MRIHIIGNCQAAVIAEQMQLLMPQAMITSDMIHSRLTVPPEAEVLFVQKPHEAQVRAVTGAGAEFITWPAIVFGGFHPDIVSVPGVLSPTAGWHSAIALQAFRLGLNEAEAESLFRPEVFEHLNFHRLYEIGLSHLKTWLDAVDFPADEMLTRWTASGCFMHGTTHPRRLVTEDVALELAGRLGGKPDDYALRNFGIDRLALSAAWGVYPWISAQRGLGRGQFLYRNSTTAPENPGKIYMLEEFIAASYQIYRNRDPAALQSERLNHPRYQSLADLIRSPAKAAPADNPPDTPPANPYRGLPAHQFWKNAVARPACGEVDPVVSAKFRISATDLVATAGSCFAQHIARTLVSSGFNYYIAETAPATMAPAAAEERQFGLFSARFGNLYTPRQLVQLFDRAFGGFTPEDSAWETSGDRLVDPFRPTVEPGGYTSRAALEADRAAHLASVREMFTRLSVFVFTLGLTEGWRAKSDGAVFPLAPGVAGGSMDASRYEFVNFTTSEVESDLDAIFTRIRSVNPSAKLILTVSPVPLIATYEPRHALVSTTASKATLRAAVETITRREPDVAYFPSFEIITGLHAGNRYFAEDLRSVRPEGVSHVMSLFLRHYAGVEGGGGLRPDPSEEDADLAKETQNNQSVVCDEERIAV